MPGKMDALRQALGLPRTTLAEAARFGTLAAAELPREAPQLFPRIEEKKTVTEEKTEEKTEQTPLIEFDDFMELDLRVAEVKEAKKHPNADRLLVLTLDLGDETRTVVAGLAEHYAPGELAGKKVLYLANLRPKKLRGVLSQGMVLAAEGPNGRLSVLTPDRDLPPGAKVR